MMLPIRDVVDLYHNRHEKMEICERSKPKLLVVSYNNDNEFEHMILKVQANEELYVREPQIYMEIAMDRVYKVPISKEQKIKYIERKKLGDEIPAIDAFFEIRGQLQRGELEGYIQDISGFDLLYQTSYKRSSHDNKFVMQFSEC